MMAYPTHAELVARLHAARAANPNSQLRRYMDDPALYRQACVEARKTARERAPHLFDPDLAQRLWQRMGGDDVPVLDTDREDVEPKRRTRRPTLTGVAKQAAKAGVPVAAFDVKPDGSIRVIVGTPDTQEPDTSKEWDGVLLQ